MTDREKVIKGFEVCLSGGLPGRCVECPYQGMECTYNKMKDALRILKEQEEHRKGLVAEMDAMYSLLKEKYDTYSLIQLLSSRDGVEKTYVEPGQEYEAPFIYGPATVLVIQG